MRIVHSPVKYVGDLPDYVLDRVAVVRRQGFELGTIHSMQVMPVELVVHDPVLVAWRRNPCLYREWSGRWSCEDQVGLIVAMWDMDKEVTLDGPVP